MSAARGLIAVAVLLAGIACDRPKVAPAPEDTGPKPVESLPTEEQRRALANELHRVHVESPEQQIRCRDCHRIQGADETDAKHRCAGCHENQRSAVHVAVASKEAKECQTCHDFLSEIVDPWACGTCHIEGEDRTSTVEALPDAPIVSVHAKESCALCHQPHGDQSREPGQCMECHEESGSLHQKGSLDEPQQCIACHGGHSPAREAEDTCTKCHDNVASAATFTGHDDCTTCHTPHGTRETKTCSSCHDRMWTVASDKSPGHDRCRSCHPAHRVRTAAPSTCAKCHDDITTHHTPDEKLGTCAGCHPQHDRKNRSAVARQCSGSECHAVASDAAFHAGSDCSKCHESHDFDLAGKAGPQCYTCHGAAHTGAKKGATATPVSVVKGHDKCLDCHEKGPHFPEQTPKDCALCHKDQKKQMTKGHEACADCHTNHEGTVNKTCIQCHDSKAQGRHKDSAKACADCHRAHGPEGPVRPKQCATCHDKALPGLHAVRDHKACRDCHGFHDNSPRRGRGTCLTACHADQIKHEPEAKSCVGCHPFEKKVKGVP